MNGMPGSVQTWFKAHEGKEIKFRSSGCPFLHLATIIEAHTDFVVILIDDGEMIVTYKTLGIFQEA